jgi:hypothetical protein
LLYAELERWGSAPWWNTSEARTSSLWPGIQPEFHVVPSSGFVA